MGLHPKFLGQKFIKNECMLKNSFKNIWWYTETVSYWTTINHLQKLIWFTPFIPDSNYLVLSLVLQSYTSTNLHILGELKILTWIYMTNHLTVHGNHYFLEPYLMFAIRILFNQTFSLEQKKVDICSLLPNPIME